MNNGILDSSQKIITNGLILNYDVPQLRSYPATGVDLTDLSGNSNSATLVNGVGYSSSNGGNLTFDGLNDRVSKSSAINTGNDFTVSAWIKPAALAGVRRAIVANSTNYSGRNGWLFTIQAGTNNFFLTLGNDSSYRVSAANILTLNQWVYLTATVSGGGSDMKLYKNNAETAYSATLLTSGTITYTYPQFNVGYRDTAGTGDPYSGGIAQVQLYNRTLSLTEVTQNFNANKSRYGL